MTGTDVSTYVDGSMYPAEPMPGTLPAVHVVQVTPDPLGSIAAAAAIYSGHIVTAKHELTDEARRDAWEAMRRTKLNAAMEFVHVHLFVTGVTRAFTHQMVRQRTAVYAQESMRFAVKEDMVEACQLPPSLAMLPKNDPRVQAWQSALNQTQVVYEALIGNGIPAEDARSLLPTAITTRLHYSTDLRNLFMHVANRTCTQAQFEWRHYVAALRAALRAQSHWYLCADGPDPVDDNWQWNLIARDLVRPPCYDAGHCTFMAEFDRPCKIRDRVQEGRFDEIDETEYLLDPQAAWDR